MYLGQVIFFCGLAFLFGSWLALAVFMMHLFWFDHRARHNEAHLLQLVGYPYADYCRRVKRWVPSVYLGSMGNEKRR
jgi:protein-S-isoprenylcysteine O-methyltransferase Ste14